MTSDELRRLADDYFAGLAFALKHGPDAARLLADAMDALQTASECCARPYGVCCEWIELQGRFAALGVSS